MRRSTRIRSTVVRRGDVRVVGYYEQTMDWPSVVAGYQFTARRLGSSAGLDCSGRGLRVSRLDYADLVDIARVRLGGTFGVDMVDLLAALGLPRVADVVVFTDAAGDELAVPVRELTQGGALLLGSIRVPFAASGGAHSCRLDVDGWTDHAAPFCPVRLRAITFNEFVQCL